MSRIILPFILLFISLIDYSYQNTYSYNVLPISTALFNPERGFYVHTEVFSASYESLDLATIIGYKSKYHSIILRVFYLEKFLVSNISDVYLNNVRSDFSKIRQAGLKCIVRFAYSNSDGSIGALDASKTQMLKHIEQIKPILQQNEDVIYVMQTGLIGAWGEWYYTDHFGYPEVTSTDLQNRKDIVFGLLTALPKNRMVQLRTPFYKRKFFSQIPLSRSEAFKETNKSRVGHHNDCFLASADDYGTYQDKSVEYPYLANDTLYTPMGGETCAPNPPRSSCSSALTELKKFHWSYLNIGYNEDVINGFKTGGCFSTIQSKLGYRFELATGTYPDKVYINSKSFSFSFKIKNSGFASPFNQRSVYLVLKNTVTNAVFSIKLVADLRFWLPDTTTSVSETVALPTGITAGSYKLYLNLPDSSSGISKRADYSIRLANSNLWESSTGYNSLSHTLVLA